MGSSTSLDPVHPFLMDLRKVCLSIKPAWLTFCVFLKIVSSTSNDVQNSAPINAELMTNEELSGFASSLSKQGMTHM